MRVSTNSVDITPIQEVYLSGYVGEARRNPAEGVHDASLAVSVLIESKERFLLLSIDTLAIGDLKVDELKKEIMKIISIPYNHIIINAIHSHSLPTGFMDDSLFGIPDNVNYYQYAKEKILSSLQDLESKLTDVSVEVGSCKIEGYFSKRTDIQAPFENNATIIRFKNNDKIIAVMCNINCHATVLGPQNMLISSDLMGSVRSKLADEFKIVPYMFAGASGDISNRQYRQGNDFTELERVSLGVFEQLKNIQNYHDINLKFLKTCKYDYHVSYDNTKYYGEYNEELNKVVSTLAKDEISSDEWKLATSEKAILENKLKIKDVSFHVKGVVVLFDDLTLVTFPGELSSKFGLELRAKCKTDNFILIGYSNGYQGYFIEQEEYGKTYETKATSTPKGEAEKIEKMIEGLL